MKLQDATYFIHTQLSSLFSEVSGNSEGLIVTSSYVHQSHQEGRPLGGAGRLLLGIVLIIVFFFTLTIDSIPIIWTGAAIVGALFIFQGLREMISGKQYKCKTCGYRGGQRDVLVHALNAHPEQFSDAERQKLGVVLGIPVPAVTEDSMNEQPLETDKEVGTIPE